MAGGIAALISLAFLLLWFCGWLLWLLLQTFWEAMARKLSKGEAISICWYERGPD
jgi:hypothetical protein